MVGAFKPLIESVIEYDGAQDVQDESSDSVGVAMFFVEQVSERGEAEEVAVRVEHDCWPD